MSLAWEGVSGERMNLEYLCWHLEMWRSVFLSPKAVEYARKMGRCPETHIADWYASTRRQDMKVALELAQEYWRIFSGAAGMY
jgi:hypothetical protein